MTKIGLGIEIRVGKHMVIKSEKIIKRQEQPLCSTKEHDVKSVNSRMEDFLSRLINGLESQQNFLKDITVDIS